MKAKQSKKQDKQYQIPMVVTDEVIRDFGIKQEDVTWRRIGNRKCRVVMVDAMVGCARVFFYPLKFPVSVLSEIEGYRLEGQR